MKNISDRNCREIKTHFICNNFFPEDRAVYEIMWEIGEATGDDIIRRMRFACWITKATHTHL